MIWQTLFLSCFDLSISRSFLCFANQCFSSELWDCAELLQLLIRGVRHRVFWPQTPVLPEPARLVISLKRDLRPAETYGSLNTVFSLSPSASSSFAPFLIHPGHRCNPWLHLLLLFSSTPFSHSPCTPFSWQNSVPQKNQIMRVSTGSHQRKSSSFLQWCLYTFMISNLPWTHKNT